MHKMPSPAASVLARWREQPRVFECLVSAYLTGEDKSAEHILSRYILGDEPFWGHGERYPTYYDDVAPEDAAGYVKQLDRLLECKGERALTEEEQENVEGIKSFLKNRAEVYERMKQREKRDRKMKSD